LHGHIVVSGHIESKERGSIIGVRHAQTRTHTYKHTHTQTHKHKHWCVVTSNPMNVAALLGETRV
jgi:hypothetical protein